MCNKGMRLFEKKKLMHATALPLQVDTNTATANQTGSGDKDLYSYLGRHVVYARNEKNVRSVTRIG